MSRPASELSTNPLLETLGDVGGPRIFRSASGPTKVGPEALPGFPGRFLDSQETVSEVPRAVLGNAEIAGAPKVPQRGVVGNAKEFLGAQWPFWESPGSENPPSGNS